MAEPPDRRRRGADSPAIPLPPDEILLEILLRLPPEPIHLLRASHVCSHWRRLVRDPGFLRRARAHHETPPVLGFFTNQRRRDTFYPIPAAGGVGRPRARDMAPLHPPIPPHRRRRWTYDCRHGRVLTHRLAAGLLVVCDLMTGKKHFLTKPPEFEDWCDAHGTALCADEHQHGDCHNSLFKVVFVFVDQQFTTVSASVYSSETDEWGQSTSIPLQNYIIDENVKQAALVGKTIYWLMNGPPILKYDLDKHTLEVIPQVPYNAFDRCPGGIVVMPAEGGGGLGLAGVEDSILHFWSMKPDKNMVLTWTICRSIDLKMLLPADVVTKIDADHLTVKTIGFSEEADVIFISVDRSVYTIHLKSMLFTEVLKMKKASFKRKIYPFAAFYTAGINTVGRIVPAKCLKNI